MRDDLLGLRNTRTYKGLKNLYLSEQQNYLYKDMSIKLKKMILRIRIESNTLYMNDYKISIDPNEECTWCNLEEGESWAHVLYRCEYLNELRSKMKLGKGQMNMTQL